MLYSGAGESPSFRDILGKISSNLYGVSSAIQQLNLDPAAEWSFEKCEVQLIMNGQIIYGGYFPIVSPPFVCPYFGIAY